MLLHKEFDAGVLLSKKELKEMVKMYKSGKYYTREILDEYGLNTYSFNVYMNIAVNLGFINATPRFPGTNKCFKLGE